MPAPEAAGYGLVSRVTADELVEQAAADLVQSLLAQPRTALVAAKCAVGVDLEARRDENDEPGWLFSGPELPERVHGFLTRTR